MDDSVTVKLVHLFTCHAENIRENFGGMLPEQGRRTSNACRSPRVLGCWTSQLYAAGNRMVDLLNHVASNNLRVAEHLRYRIDWGVHHTSFIQFPCYFFRCFVRERFLDFLCDGTTSTSANEHC